MREFNLIMKYFRSEVVQLFLKASLCRKVCNSLSDLMLGADYKHKASRHNVVMCCNK